jgi:hypothetical protein
LDDVHDRILRCRLHNLIDMMEDEIIDLSLLVIDYAKYFSTSESLFIIIRPILQARYSMLADILEDSGTIKGWTVTGLKSRYPVAFDRPSKATPLDTDAARKMIERMKGRKNIIQRGIYIPFHLSSGIGMHGCSLGRSELVKIM